MPHVYIPPPSVVQWQDQFALFLAKFGWTVTITIRRGEEHHTVERGPRNCNFEQTTL